MKRRNAAVNSGGRQIEVDGTCGFAGGSGAACSAHCEGCQAQRGGDRRLDAQHDSVARHRRGRTMDFNAGAQGFLEPVLRLSVKLQNRQSVEAALCSSTNTEVRFHAIPYSVNWRCSP